MADITRRTWLQISGISVATGCATTPPDPRPTPDGSDARATGDGSGRVDAPGAPDAVDLPDAGADAELDAELDAGLDAGTDAALEAGTDARMDAGTDAQPDAPPVPRDADFTPLPERATLFPMGTMAGDATATRVVFWTRYTGSDPLMLRVLEMDGTRITAVRYNAQVRPADAAGYVHADVGGLTPGRRHTYAFLVAPGGRPNGRSAVGRVRTALADDALEPITFAGTSCSRQHYRPFNVLARAGARTDLDFFVHCGDHVYADFEANAETLAQYRTKYAQNWSDAGMRALHRSVGMYTTWDDHEVVNNFDPETTPAAQIVAGRRAFFEHRAIRRNAAAPDRIWRSFRWGRTAEVFVLDCRGERRPSTRATAGAQYISRAQMDWLKAGLTNSRAVFKLIVNSVPIALRSGASSDTWTGYMAQRSELLNHIVNSRIQGVLWLSGDVHFGAVARLEDAGAYANIHEVFMGPAGHDRGDGGMPGYATGVQWPVVVYPEQNFALFRANPTTRTIAVEFINSAGTRIPGSTWTHTFE